MQIFYFQIGHGGVIIMKCGNATALQQYLDELNSQTMESVKLIGIHPGDEARLIKIKVFFNACHTDNGFYLPSEAFIDFINKPWPLECDSVYKSCDNPLTVKLKMNLCKDLQDNPLPEALKQKERDYIIEAMKEAKGIQKIAAELLGISGPSLNQRINRLRIPLGSLKREISINTMRTNEDDSAGLSE